MLGYQHLSVDKETNFNLPYNKVFKIENTYYFYV